MVMRIPSLSERTLFLTHRELPTVKGCFRAEGASEGDAAIISEIRTTFVGHANEGENPPENERGRSRRQNVHRVKRRNKRGNCVI